MKLFYFFIFLFFLASCQKEFNAPPTETEPIIRTHEIAAIVVTNGLQGDYDSVVYLNFADKNVEIHYNYSGDSTIRTYHYDAKGRLSKLEDEKAIFYTNNSKAKSITFIYNNSGDLKGTLTDFTTVQGVNADYNTAIAADAKNIIVNDTMYKSASYDLDWVNRTIFNTVSNNDLLLYDSCIYDNYRWGNVTTIVSSYSYDANSNARTINKSMYHNRILSEYGTTTINNDKPAPVFEALRKKLYRNLSGWYQSSSAMQDDSYNLFPVPGSMYKAISYVGHSQSDSSLQQVVQRSYTFDNTYNDNDISDSKVTYSMAGQGSAGYSFDIRYYYK